MRFTGIAVVVLSASFGDVAVARRHSLTPEALVQLGIDMGKPVDVEAIKENAKKRFMTLMHDAEEKAAHDPSVLKAEEIAHKAHLKFEVDSHKAADLLKGIKTKLADGKKNLAAHNEEFVKEEAELKRFTDEQYHKLSETEKKFMALQQKRIASFAELSRPRTNVATSFTELSKGRDGTKASQEIHAAEKALHELGESIKKRVDTLTHQLMTPGKQFQGEVVV